MKARFEGNYFGGEQTAGGNQFKYSEWSHYVPTDLSDLDKEIVQAPPYRQQHSEPRTHCRGPRHYKYTTDRAPVTLDAVGVP